VIKKKTSFHECVQYDILYDDSYEA